MLLAALTLVKFFTFSELLSQASIFNFSMGIINIQPYRIGALCLTVLYVATNGEA